MIFAYLLRNLFLDILLFFKHWYYDGLIFIYGKALGIIRGFEKGLAIRINVRFIFQPLYQERNIYGYILGFLFRSFRIITGTFLYFLVIAGALMIYIFWASIPVYAVYQIIKGI
jgi:hypothetical protein